jgi:hypothetical protein
MPSKKGQRLELSQDLRNIHKVQNNEPTLNHLNSEATTIHSFPCSISGVIRPTSSMNLTHGGIEQSLFHFGSSSTRHQSPVIHSFFKEITQSPAGRSSNSELLTSSTMLGIAIDRNDDKPEIALDLIQFPSDPVSNL